jgi:hypothetical protein
VPKKRVSKKGQARCELAERLRKPLTDILDQEEAAAFLGKKSRTSLSNLKENGPGFYRKPGVRYVLYRRDWLKLYARYLDNEKDIDGKRIEPPWGPQPWPPARYTGSHAASEAFLDMLVGDKLKDDVAYKRVVMGD